MVYFGNVMLFITTVASVVVVSLFVTRLQGVYKPERLKIPYRSIYVLFGLATLTSMILLYGFIAMDFAFEYVANNSSSNMGLFYRISAFWAGHEGSFLFWLWLISGISALIAFFRDRIRDKLTSIALLVMGSVQIFFLIFLLFVANPFKAAYIVIDTGLGINPLLMHWAMIFHPPTLFVGYAAMVVPFAYAIAALVDKDASSEWVERSQRWTIFAWLFLSIGIFLGALWAYVVLGWGGYWGWDPVENASLLPWFGGLALLHSFHIYKQRKSFKHWALGLSVFSFVMVMVGTFITRSGIIQSVHAFEQNSAVVALFGIFLLTIIAGSVYLMATRWQLFESEHVFSSLFSRDIMYHLNNIIMLFASTVLLFGAFLPLFAGGASIGTDAYEQIARPIGIVFLAIISICPLVSFGQTDLNRFLKRIAIPTGVTVVSAVPLFYYWQSLNDMITAVNPKALPPPDGWMGYVGLLVAVFAATAVFVAIGTRIKTRYKATGGKLLPTIAGYFVKTPGAAGGFIAHLGMAIIVAGLIGSSMFTASLIKTIPNKAGETIKAADVEFKFKELKTTQGEGKEIYAANLEVTRKDDSKNTKQISPRIVFYQLQESTTREVDILYEPFRDIFVVFQGEDEKGLTFEIKINPLISFVWIGSILLVIGTVVAVWPRRKSSKGQ